MAKQLKWEYVEGNYIYGEYTEGPDYLIGYLDEDNAWHYYDVPIPIPGKGTANPFGNAESAPRKFRSDWNQRQYDAYQKRNNEAKSRNHRSPDFLTDDIQFTSLQHHSPYTSKWVASKISQFENTVRENIQRIREGVNQQTKSKEISKGVIDKFSFHQEEELQEARNSYNILGQFASSLGLVTNNMKYGLIYTELIETQEQGNWVVRNKRIEYIKEKDMKHYFYDYYILGIGSSYISRKGTLVVLRKNGIYTEMGIPKYDNAPPYPMSFSMIKIDKSARENNGFVIDYVGSLGLGEEGWNYVAREIKKIIGDNKIAIIGHSNGVHLYDNRTGAEIRINGAWGLNEILKKEFPQYVEIIKKKIPTTIYLIGCDTDRIARDLSSMHSFLTVVGADGLVLPGLSKDKKHVRIKTISMSSEYSTKKWKFYKNGKFLYQKNGNHFENYNNFR